MNEAEMAAEPATAARIAESPGRGRGVFARRMMRAGTVIERAPVLVMPRSDLLPLRGKLLDDYWFWWDDDHSACALGWASLYNHACPSNATFRLLHDVRMIEFTAVRDIAIGEEITINYQGEPDDPTPPWFFSR